MEHWHLVQTKPSQERQVAVQLHQRGIVVYLPLIWVSPVHPHGERERPYFPGYLFAKLDLQSLGVGVIRWLPGVKGLLEFCGEPVHISDAFVTELEQCLNRVRAVGAMDTDGSRRAEFLHVNQGPFEGYEGIFNARLFGQDRTEILLACIQKDYWRQDSQTRPGADVPDDPATPRPSW